MDINKYIYSHCISPSKIKVFDSYSKSFVVREVPCGKCLHCTNTAISSWVTRLTAQYYDSKFCYFVSLDYAPFDPSVDVAKRLAYDSAACYHDINKNHMYGLHPLVLCKSHLQNFFKRLRNNGHKFQYFACGEYGTHANGRGFGRPHFHCIVFSNSPITYNDFVKSWTIDGYVIGRVDLVDMKCFQNVDTENLKIFKYVCKYLQKKSFSFEKLATIDFHRAYFKSLQVAFEEADTLFPRQVPITDSKVLDYNWKQYIKQFAPFSLCSKRPAIGFEYLQRNLQRFKEADFRLFGLPNSCVTFPRYFVRKTKEASCYFSAVGSISQKPSSPSRVGYVLSVLRTISNYRSSFKNYEFSSETYWRVLHNKVLIPYNGADSIAINDLHLYDHLNNEFYQFTGYGYNVWQKVKKLGFVLKNKYSIDYVINKIQPIYKRYFNTFVVPQHYNSLLVYDRLYEYIRLNYEGNFFIDKYSNFREHVYSIYEQELSKINKTNLLIQNSKTTL